MVNLLYAIVLYFVSSISSESISTNPLVSWTTSGMTFSTSCAINPLSFSLFSIQEKFVGSSFNILSNDWLIGCISVFNLSSEILENPDVLNAVMLSLANTSPSVNTWNNVFELSFACMVFEKFAYCSRKSSV